LVKKLRIGYYDNLPTLASSNSVKASIKIAREALKAKGHILVEFALTQEECREYIDIYLKCVCIAFMGPLFKSLYINGERPMPFYKKFDTFWSAPLVLKKIVIFLVGAF